MNWKKVKLGKICKNLDGKRKPLNNIERQKIRGNGAYPYFGANNIMDWVDEFIFDEKILCIAEDGGSWGSNQKCCFIYEGKCWVNNHAHVLKSNEDTSLEFLMYYLNYSNLNSYITGSTRGKLTKSSLESIEIPLPDLTTQQHIAKVLDQADALRQQNRQLLAHYDELLQSTFIDLFGDPVKNEKGWEVKKLGEVSEVVSGVAKNGNLNGDLVEAPYMRVANVQDGQLNLSEIKTIQVFKRDFEKYQLKYNDILMTEGGDPDKLGRAAIWKEQIKNCIHQNHIFRVRPDFAILDSGYLCLLVGSAYGKRYFLKAAKQTTGIASINITQLKNFPVILLPLPLQQHFAQIVEQIEDQKAVVKQSLAETEVLFEGLLAEYFG